MDLKYMGCKLTNTSNSQLFDENENKHEIEI